MLFTIFNSSAIKVTALLCRLERAPTYPVINPYFADKTAGIYAHSTPENKMKAVEEASKKWTMRHRDWAMIYSQLMILFEDRVAKYV